MELELQRRKLVKPAETEPHESFPSNSRQRSLILEMVQLQGQSKKLYVLNRLNSIGSCLVSCVLGLLTHLALSLVPCFFSASSPLIQLSLSGVVLFLVVGFGRWCRKLVGVSASAPAFVFFNIVFIWIVYALFVRQGVSIWINVLFNGEILLLLIGLCSILSSDPGFVTYGSPSSNELDETQAFAVEAQNQGSLQFERLRYCKSCKAYIKSFDHHCPAFGNCIGKNNHVLFMVLLFGFLITEISYVLCSYQFVNAFHTLGGTISEVNFTGNVIISTMFFCLLQVMWQAVFGTWHIYCICFNIKTDEWINWQKYPEFQLVTHSQPGENISDMRFTNPYDKGILRNLREFLAAKG